MRIWRVESPLDQEIVTPADDYLDRWAVHDWELLSTPDPVDRSAWSPPRMQIEGGLIEPDATQTAPVQAAHADVFVVTRTEVFLRDDVKTALDPLLTPYGEFLPVDGVNAALHLWHCTTPVDCLDEARSDCLVSPSDPERVLMIDRAVFRPEAVPAEGVFVLPARFPMYLWATDDFVTRFGATGAQGIRFGLEWDSDAG